MKKVGKKSIRLESHIVPLKYDITLKPDLKSFTFEGIETITLEISKKTKSITLHSKEIEIATAHIEKDGEKIFADKISYDEERETATFTFPKNLEARPKEFLKLKLVFKGILSEKMRGFYRSKYVCDGKEYFLATTQFEATDARRAFPCFDEPARKAVFHVSLVVPKGHTAISNTLPVSIREHDPGFEIIKFSPTPKMSTYLLAFITGKLELIEGRSARKVQVRVFTTPGKIHQAKFALECGIKMLDFYEKYFDIPYPLPILDMIAIPDFQAGAMENWGAITYRESALLIDEKNSSLSNKQRVAIVIAHELAHQWFGNLVTMEWWTHLWLNEGFASYMEYLAVDKMFPWWDIWTQFSVYDLGRALHLDGLANTHPIEIPVHHPNEIGEIFDEVSYSKGASVIKMLAGFIGEKNFRDGLRYYLKKHSYKNTETTHLWEAFEKVSKKPVREMMQKWTNKPGYPVITANIKNDKLEINQRKFFASPISKKENKDDTVWEIPITMGNKFTKSKIFMKNKNFSAPAPKYQWLKINLGEDGFYRVAYSKEMLDRLIEPVSKKTISARDRLGIVRDLFALSESGDINTTDALNFLRAYKNERDYYVWLEIAIGLSRLKRIFLDKKIENGLNKLTIELFSPTFKRLGWSNQKHESDGDTLLRPLCISKLGQAGEKNILKKANELFEKIKKDGHVNPDLRGTIYQIVATRGSFKEYKYLVEKYKKETLHAERDRIGSALGEFSLKGILEQIPEFALSKDVKAQDTINILHSLALNPLGRDIWLKCMRANWQTFVSRYGEGGHTFGTFIKSISSTAEEKHLKTFKQFLKTHKAPGAERAVEQVIERIESNIAWLKRDGMALVKFFDSFKD